MEFFSMISASERLRSSEESQLLLRSQTTFEFVYVLSMYVCSIDDQILGLVFVVYFRFFF